MPVGLEHLCRKRGSVYVTGAKRAWIDELRIETGCLGDIVPTRAPG